MTSAIVRWSRKAQLVPAGTSRAAIAVSTFRQAPWAGKPITASRTLAQGPTSLARGIPIRGRADRNPSPGVRVPRQQSRPVTPFRDRLGRLIAASLEPVPNGAARIGSGEHGDNGGDPGSASLSACGVLGRQIDRERGLDSRRDQVPVLDGDSVVAEHGLVGEGDNLLAGIGGDEFFKHRAVDLCAVLRQITSLRIPPQTPGPKRCNFGTELRPAVACQAAGYAIPMHGEGAANMTPARQSTRAWDQS